jgi:predicted anti-sigma-YlaC factor YlaD
MDCTQFADRLDAMLEGALPLPEQALTDAHAAHCATCRRLYAELRALREAGTAPPGAPAPDLTDGILARTSGSVCAQAETYLGELVDEALGALDRELVEAHLETCAACASLRTALERLQEDLPGFAEICPAPALTHAVLARTRQPTLRRTAAMLELGRGLLQRPRIAWEAGYVAALVVWLVFGASWSPLRATPVQALTLLQQSTSGTQQAGADVIAAFSRQATAVTERTFGDATTGANAIGRVALGLSTRYLQAAAAAPDLAGHWEQFTTAVEHRDLFAGAGALRSLGRDAGAVLTRFLVAPTPTMDSGAPPERRSES